MFRRIAMLSVVSGALMLPVMVQAQDQGGNGNNGGNNAAGDQSGRGNRGNRGNFDPAQFRQQMEDRMKEQLGNPTDDEWKVIQPKLEKVMTIQRESRGSMGMMFGRSGRSSDRGGNNADSQPKNDVQKAQEDLKSTLDKKDASVDDINAKLAALRSARDKSRADLKSAQKDLSEVLTARQVAALVMMGMLE
jgi:hypothetical protein